MMSTRQATGLSAIGCADVVELPSYKQLDALYSAAVGEVVFGRPAVPIAREHIFATKDGQHFVLLRAIIDELQNFVISSETDVLLDEPRGLSAADEPGSEGVTPHPVAPNTQEEGT